MGYRMYEFTQEEKGELMEHAEKAYEHIGKMLECVESLRQKGSMGMRDDDEYYIRRYNREPMMDERMGYRGEGGGYGERMGRRSESMDGNRAGRVGMRWDY